MTGISRDDPGSGVPAQVAETIARLERTQREADRIRRTVDELVVRACSRGSEVTVAMRGTGRVTEISIDPDALRRFAAHDIGALVTEAVNNARDRLTKATQSRFAPLIAEADRLSASV